MNASPQADTEGPRGGLCGVPPVVLMPLLLHSRRVLALLPVRGKGELRFAASLGELTRAGCSPGPLVVYSTLPDSSRVCQPEDVSGRSLCKVFTGGKCLNQDYQD